MTNMFYNYVYHLGTALCYGQNNKCWDSVRIFEFRYLDSDKNRIKQNNVYRDIDRG